METNKIFQGDVLTVLKTLTSESINCVVTSPPYWALRDYGSSVEVIWDMKEGCEHEWIQGKSAGNFTYRAGATTTVGNNKNPEIFNIPSRNEFTNKDVSNNTLSNKEITITPQISNFCLKCDAWKGQLGLEPTFDLYISHLCDIFDEIKRVLRKDGCCFVNIGDTYSTLSGGMTQGKWGNIGLKGFKEMDGIIIKKQKTSLPDKSLCQIPSRFAIEMCNRGWILRNELIWHKPNCMPSSVRDRFTVDFEKVFFFVKNKKYFFERQFEPQNYDEAYYRNKLRRSKNYTLKEPYKNNFPVSTTSFEGRNMRSVWTIQTHPFPEAHFATYPEKLIEPMIKSGCPEFVCMQCGKAREKIYEVGDILEKRSPERGKMQSNSDIFGNKSLRDGYEKRELVYRGYTSCSCNASFESGIVLDPFMGAGTTALVALKQNKKFIGIELNPEYITIAQERLRPYLEQKKLIEVNA